MKLGSGWRAGAVLALLAALLVPACGRKKSGEVNDITPSVTLNRTRAPLGSAIEVTYTWKLEPTAKKLTQEFRGFVHFLDSHKELLFTDDHLPTPAPSTWEPGKTYSYTRTVFIPVRPYVGEVQIAVGLYPAVGKGERIGLKGEDIGLRAYRVLKMEFLPQTENIYPVFKEGWHSPESSVQNPGQERTWTKKEATMSFKNPKKDVVIYLEADTNFKAFDAPPVLTMTIGKAGITVPIENSEVFLKKVHVTASDLGTEEYVDVHLNMNQSFVPKAKGISATDDRELGLMVYHLYVGEADKLATVPDVVDAAPMVIASPSPAPAKPGAKPAAKPPAKPAAKPATK